MATVSKAPRATRRQFQTRLLINGEWRESVSGKRFATINPATEEVIAEVAEGDAADIDLAVKAARKAFDSGPWRKTDARDRGKMMHRLAELIEDHIDELAELETLDNGKPIRESRNADLPLVIDCLHYYAGWADKIHGQTVPIRGNYFCYIKREPVGVAGQIIPWNFPMLMVAWKWGPALAAGCAVLIKPSEATPRFVPALRAAIDRVPELAAVLQIVTGPGTTGEALIRNSDVICFTGSVRTGRQVAKLAADAFIPAHLELGGKDAAMCTWCVASKLPS